MIKEGFHVSKHAAAVVITLLVVSCLFLLLRDSRSERRVHPETQSNASVELNRAEQKGGALQAALTEPSKPALAERDWSPELLAASLGDIAVSGIVRDAGTRKGVANVSVVIQGDEDTESTRTVTTGEDGTFALRVPYFQDAKKNNWRVFPVHQSYFLPYWFEYFTHQLRQNGMSIGALVRDGAEGAGLFIRIDADDPTPQSLSIDLKRGARVVGRVVDASGTPISGANIITHLTQHDMMTRLIDKYASRSKVPPVVTREDGSFELANIPTSVASFEIAATHPEWVSRWHGPFEPSDDTNVDIVMQRAASLEIDLKGVWEAQVDIQTKGAGRWADCESSTWSDIGKTAVVRRVPPGDVSLRARFLNTEDTSKSITVHDLKPGERRRVSLSLAEYHQIAGSLVDEKGGAIAEESLELRLDDGRRVVGECSTGDAGEYQFDGLTEPGHYSLWIVTANRVEQIKDRVSLGHGHRVTTTPTPLTTIRVSIEDSLGKIVKGAHLRLMGLEGHDVEKRSDRTSLDTHVHTVNFLGVVPIVVCASVQETQDTRAPDCYSTCVVIDRVSAEAVTIRLANAPTLMGRIVDCRQVPVASARIALSNGESVVTDVRGHYRYVWPEGQSVSGEAQDDITAKLSAPRDVRVDGDEFDISFDRWNCLTLYRGGRTITGRLVGEAMANRGDLSRVDVVAEWKGDRDPRFSEGIFETRTDKAGAFALPVMPHKTVEVWVDKHELARRGFRANRQTMVALPGINALEFRLERGVSVSGFLTGSELDATDLSRIRIEARAKDFSTAVHPVREAGRLSFRFEGLPPGPVDLLVSEMGGPLLGMKSAVHAPSSDVTIPLDYPNGRISGTLDLSDVPLDCRMLVMAFPHDDLEWPHYEYSDPKAFTFTGLRKETTYTLSVQPSEMSAGHNVVALKQGVRVGETVELKPVAGEYITGRLQGAATYVSSVQATIGVVSYGYTPEGPERTFRLGPLAPGVYTIEARDENYDLLASKADVRAGENDVVLVLK